MAQFARPVSDVALGGWSGPAFSTIDEAVADDADFTQSPTGPANAILEVALGSVEDPQSSTGHAVRYRFKKDTSGGSQIDLTVELVQGTTVIASWLHANISDLYTDAAQTLTAAQADAITNYADLRLRFIANQP